MPEVTPEKIMVKEKIVHKIQKIFLVPSKKLQEERLTHKAGDRKNPE